MMNGRRQQRGDDRRADIVSMARKLFASQGYSQVSVQVIIDACGIAKGTFYHHFASRQELLEAVTDRIADEGLALVDDLVQRPDLDAPTRLELMFTRVSEWKVALKPMLMDMMKVLLRADNSVFWQKMTEKNLEKLHPLYAGVIRQGVEEGWFHCFDPDETAVHFMSLMIGLRTRMMQMMIRAEQEGAVIDWPVLMRMIEAFDDSVKRILGLKTRPLKLFDEEVMKAFFCE